MEHHSNFTAQKLTIFPISSSSRGYFTDIHASVRKQYVCVDILAQKDSTYGLYITTLGCF